MPLLITICCCCQKSVSLRKHLFLLVRRSWGRFAQRNIWNSAQQFHTDDANQCLHIKSGSHGVPNIKLFNFMCLLVDFGKVLCSSAKELQQNSNTSSREDYILQNNIDCFVRDSSHLHLTSVAFCLLSVKTVIRKQ